MKKGFLGSNVYSFIPKNNNNIPQSNIIVIDVEIFEILILLILFFLLLDILLLLVEVVCGL